MPMCFPTFESLMRRAEQRNFRQPNPNEGEDEYRKAFANFMQNIDMVEAGEIRLGSTPMDMVAELDPMSALAAIMGKDPSDINNMMNNFFGE